VFNATFNNISVISWPSVLLVEEAEVPGENHRPVRSHWQTLSHNVVLSTPRHKRGSNSRIFFHNFDILLKGKPVLCQNIIFFSHYFCIYRTKLYTVVTFQTEIRYKLHGNISTGFHTSKIKREKLTQVHVFSYLTSHYVKNIIFWHKTGLPFSNISKLWKKFSGYNWKVGLLYSV
jgi:hypothetical protein